MGEFSGDGERGDQGIDRLAGQLSREAEERQRAEAALRFVAEASATLAESLDYQTTLNKVVRLAVPFLSDWCTVDVLDETGVMRRVAAGHRDPELERQLREIRERESEWGSPAATMDMLVDGKSLLFPEVTQAVLDRYVRDSLARELVAKLGIRSGMGVPMLIQKRPVGVMTFTTITPDRRYDQFDLALAEELARRAAVAIDNARLYGQAQDAVRMRDEFMSVASHELNTPITSLQLLVQGIQPEELAAQPEELARTVETITRQTRRLAALVEGIMEVGRIHAGLLHLELKDVDVVQLLNQLVGRLAGDLARARCPLTVQGPASLVGRWDAVRLEQVLSNLLSNAMKFGSGKPILVTVMQDGHLAKLVIEDQGIGVPAERLPHIFGRFERAVPASEYGGLGLGLYIVREVIQAFGGTVRAESQVGVGSRFTVTLPLRRAL